VVACGQVEGEVPAAVAGGAGGHGDEVAADGGGAGLRVPAAGEGPGGSQQVMGHGGDDEPGGVCPEMTGWQVGEGAGVQVGGRLLDDGVVAVLPFGLGQLERRAGKYGVIPPRGEQLVRPLVGPVVAGAGAADDQPGGDLRGLSPARLPQLSGCLVRVSA
jgi:hypothetical protein